MLLDITLETNTPPNSAHPPACPSAPISAILTPVKLIHFADLHIGVENYGRPDPDTGMSTRLLDFLSAYDEMVQYAIDNRVDAVIFAGDAYKNRDPSQTHQREFAKRIAQLASEGIAVFLITGNHDLPAVAGRASALEIFPTLAVERVHVSDRIETTLLRTRSGPLQVVSLPWIRRSRFLTRDDTRNLTIDQITQRLQERLTYSLTWELQNLKPNIPAILVGHVTVSGSRVGAERSMMLGRDHVLLLSTLSDPSLDYVALGHIHKYQVLGHNPMIVYPGSMQRVDFSEETESKGFCVLEIDPNLPQGQRLASFDFQPVQARTFITIDVDIPAHTDDPTRAVLEAIARKYVSQAIVRVRISLPEELEPRLREPDIRAALKDAHHIASIQRNVVRSRRTRIAPEAGRGLSPADAIRLYFTVRDTDPKRAQTLLAHADALIQEELEDSHHEPPA